MIDSKTVDKVVYGTKDPQNFIGANNVPAMTTMLFKVCDNNPEKFNEAMRLVELYIREALGQTQ